uniref:(northern house mosquito) hypothetical protein n=1 Tax=Culex pipiens TaxID=7175 RepID=A0A8D8FWD5_CULPI
MSHRNGVHQPVGLPAQVHPSLQPIQPLPTRPRFRARHLPRALPSPIHAEHRSKPHRRATLEASQHYHGRNQHQLTVHVLLLQHGRRRTLKIARNDTPSCSTSSGGTVVEILLPHQRATVRIVQL